MKFDLSPLCCGCCCRCCCLQSWLIIENCENKERKLIILNFIQVYNPGRETSSNYVKPTAECHKINTENFNFQFTLWVCVWQCNVVNDGTVFYCTVCIRRNPNICKSFSRFFFVELWWFLLLRGVFGIKREFFIFYID